MSTSLGSHDIMIIAAIVTIVVLVLLAMFTRRGVFVATFVMSFSLAYVFPVTAIAYVFLILKDIASIPSIIVLAVASIWLLVALFLWRTIIPSATRSAERESRRVDKYHDHDLRSWDWLRIFWPW